VSLTQLTDDLGALDAAWADQNLDITGSVNDLKTVLDQFNSVVTQHGDTSAPSPRT